MKILWYFCITKYVLTSSYLETLSDDKMNVYTIHTFIDNYIKEMYNNVSESVLQSNDKNHLLVGYTETINSNEISRLSDFIVEREFKNMEINFLMVKNNEEVEKVFTIPFLILKREKCKKTKLTVLKFVETVDENEKDSYNYVSAGTFRNTKFIMKMLVFYLIILQKTVFKCSNPTENIGLIVYYGKSQDFLLNNFRNDYVANLVQNNVSASNLNLLVGNDSIFNIKKGNLQKFINFCHKNFDTNRFTSIKIFKLQKNEERTYSLENSMESGKLDLLVDSYELHFVPQISTKVVSYFIPYISFKIFTEKKGKIRNKIYKFESNLYKYTYEVENLSLRLKKEEENFNGSITRQDNSSNIYILYFKYKSHSGKIFWADFDRKLFSGNKHTEEQNDKFFMFKNLLYEMIDLYFCCKKWYVFQEKE